MKKTGFRIITAILALLLLIGMFSGALATIARAAASPGVTENVLTADTTVSRNMTIGKVSAGLTIKFSFVNTGITLPVPAETRGNTDIYKFPQLSTPIGSSFSWGKSTELRVTPVTGEGYSRAELRNIDYNGGSSRLLELAFTEEDESFSIPIPLKYFREESAEGEAPVSDIVVQSVKLKNADGKTLIKVTKDTDPFTAEITYYDTGLIYESKASLDESDLYAFVTAAAGFKTLSGTGGKVEVLSSSAGFPYFKVTFENIKSDGSANALSFRVQYDLPEYEKSVKGEATAVLYQIETEDEEEETAPLKPNVIVQSYHYGEEPIVAGEQFDLDLEFTNTSKTEGVENVVMTITPGNGFVIAASSNTVYVPSLAPGEAQPYSVALRAAASGNTPAGGTAGAQTDYTVSVKFEYQYLSNKKYETGSTEVKIAVPVVQLDRFSIDEITDYSQYLTAGEEGYVTVPIINKGKSPTYNISAEIKGPEEAQFTSPSAHYGNLEAGKSGSVDLSLTILTPGEFVGEVVISYEDENMNQKQLAVSFSIMVSEPYVPPQEFPQEFPVEEPDGAMSPVRIVFYVLGSLMVAVPTGLYFVKRVRARGSEDIDESF